MLPAAQRLFLALWPDEALRRKLLAVRPKLGTQGGREVPATNFHVTLAFLGSVASDQVARIEQAAAGWHCRARLEFTRLAWWPKARLLCLEAPEPPAVFLDAVAALHSGLREAGFALESRPYRAHVTLVRNVGRPVACLDAPGLPVDWPVGGIALVASVQATGGSRYSVLQEWGG